MPAWVSFADTISLAGEGDLTQILRYSFPVTSLSNPKGPPEA